jgi:chemotaxis protein CheD
MIKSESSRLGRRLYILYPGEYIAVKEDCVLASITGATVTVCLYDLERKIGGMGQFIVPGTLGTHDIIADEIASHGIQSMELLMGEIVKKGGDRKYLKAKLFGAGYIKEGIPNMGGIQESNIRFLREYFNLERIEVVREDLGGNNRRKIYFYPKTGKVLRRFQRRNEDSSEFRVLEKEYIESVFKNRERTGKLILFE